MTTSIRIIGIVLIALGSWVVVFNWASPVLSRIHRRNVSPVPIVGAFFIAVGLYLLPSTRPYAWLGFVVDYGTLIAVTWIAIEIFGTRRR